MLSGAKLGFKASETQKPYFDICESVGVVDAAAPIIIEGVHIANWVIGQNCVVDVDDNRFWLFKIDISQNILTTGKKDYGTPYYSRFS